MAIFMKAVMDNDQENMIPFHVNLTQSVYDCFMEIIRAENKQPQTVFAQFFATFFKAYGIKKVTDIKNPNALNKLRINIWQKRFWIFQTKYTEQKIDALRSFPIKGDFNLIHLSKIHHFIHSGLEKQARIQLADIPQDFLNRVLLPIKPGKLRTQESSISHIHVKSRNLPYLKITSFVAYSSMGIQAVKQLEMILKKATNFSENRNFDAFINTFFEIYSWLDYIHPFEEGNSRTLWIFMKSFAITHGFMIDERPIDPKNHPEKYEQFLLLRDLAVNMIDACIAKPDARVVANMKKIKKLFNGKTLKDFFQDQCIIYRIEK